MRSRARARVCMYNYSIDLFYGLSFLHNPFIFIINNPYLHTW